MSADRRHASSASRARPRAPSARPLAGRAVRAHDAVLRAARARDCWSAILLALRVRRVAGARRSSASRSSSPTSGIRSPATSAALAPIYGTLVTSVDRAADRRAGQLRHRAVPDRDVPAVAEAAARHRGRAARGDPVDHLRHVGAVRLRAALRRLRAAAADGDVRRPAGSSAPLFQGAPNGIGMLTAGIILSVMIIPFIASVMRDVFEIVPPVLKESAYGIGCTTWEVVWNIVLPYTKVGVIGGIMLGLGRALGETMAVTFVIGNAYKISAVAVRARQLDRLRARQRVQRGGRPGAPRVADRARARAVRADVRRARAVADADRAARQGRGPRTT